MNFLFLPSSNQCINLAQVEFIGVNHHPIFSEVERPKGMTYVEGIKRGLTLQETMKADRALMASAPKPEKIGEEVEAYLCFSGGNLRKYKKAEDVKAIADFVRSIVEQPAPKHRKPSK